MGRLLFLFPPRVFARTASYFDKLSMRLSAGDGVGLILSLTKDAGNHAPEQVPAIT